MLSFFKRHKLIILYGVSLAALLLLLRWLELRFIIMDHAFDIYVGSIALIFTALGIWLALKLAKPKVQTIVVERPVMVQGPTEFVFNGAEFKALGRDSATRKLPKSYSFH
jgi:two-component system, NarL family, response regulator LiaR